MKTRSKFTMFAILFSFTIGFFFGIKPTTASPTGSRFAGYQLSLSDSQLVKATFSTVNPTVAANSSVSHWVMIGSGAQYAQSGWREGVGTGSTVPTFFTEYKCSSICQIHHGTVGIGTSHTYTVIQHYTVSLTPAWCLSIDGVCKTVITKSAAGFSAGDRVLWSGEAHDTLDTVGGTSTSPLRMTGLKHGTTSSTFDVNTGLLSSITSAGTKYRASNGGSGTSTYIDIWTTP